ncbi:MAG: ABC transporter substrate-binding protein [Rhodoferax sp.]|nr:ABC transporter substrate-binding protein [Rhodoferax sp.]MDP3654544.1 ABC transporter substrate-binding protein [Rhodoferax sp.]
MQFFRLLAWACLSTLSTLAAAQVQQGISSNEILLGTIQDLSGPLSGYGKQARNGMQMAIAEINEQGGLHGRKIKLQVEDSGYDPKKAVLAAQKLVSQDKIFMMVGHIGTAQNLAAMPIQFEREVINFFPLTAAREMYEPFHRLKFSVNPTYYEQMLDGLPLLVKQKGAAKTCAIYQDDEFGLEVLRGAQDGLKMWNLALAETATFKRGATDFSSQVARMRAAGCELVVLGTIIRETVGVIGEARKSGYSPVFLGSSASYSELIPKLGDKLVEGMYATMTAQIPYVDDASQPVRFWASKYKTQFNEDPSAMSVFGYNTLNVFAQAMRDAGPRPTTSKFIRSMETIRVPGDIFGGPPLKFTPSKRLGSNASRMSQIQDGRWKVVSGYKAP